MDLNFKWLSLEYECRGTQGHVELAKISKDSFSRIVVCNIYYCAVGGTFIFHVVPSSAMNARLFPHGTMS